MTDNNNNEDLQDNFDEESDEEMTVSVELEDGSVKVFSIITIFDVDGKDYIALSELDEDGNPVDDDVWFYGYKENPDDPNEEPELIYIEDDEEYEAVTDRFDEILDEEEFDEADSKDKE